MTHDSDRTEPPISNEELYVQTQKIGLLIYASMAMVTAAASYAAFATGTARGELLGVALLCATGWLMFKTLAKGYDGRANTVYNLIPGLSVDETLEEQSDRLTGAARADGSGGDGDE